MRPFEFWPARLAETPYYTALFLRCAAHALPIKFLAKANWALDHGELGLGSKHSTQMAFDQSYFPATTLVDFDGGGDVDTQIEAFAAIHGHELILKPDIGSVGKGIIKLDTRQDLSRQIPTRAGLHLLQVYCSLPEEYGVFFTRQNGIGRISGINRKHFPTVVGDGTRTLTELAEAHDRFSDHWRIFMRYQDPNFVPDQGERLRLSFIGSHTMGCMFTDDSHIVTDRLTQSLNVFCADQPGFNFGRLDIRTESEAALKAGEFTIIEVNGIASLPTHMFDPGLSTRQAYRILLRHAKLLVDIAVENRHRPMALDSYLDIIRRARANHSSLTALHDAAMTYE